MLRLRVLSEKELSWRQCFEISMLWEFSSAISPSAVGGTAVALVIMAQEKIKTGRTTAIVLITSLLDEIFFITMVPIVFFVIGFSNAFPAIELTENATGLFLPKNSHKDSIKFWNKFVNDFLNDEETKSSMKTLNIRTFTNTTSDELTTIIDNWKL